MEDPTAGALRVPGTRLQRLLEWLHRYRYLLAPLSFGAGLASFLLIERQEPLAQWISVLLILGWVGIVAEEAAARALNLSPALLRLGVQAIQQETFFFALPFFLHTTTWSTGQAVFTGAACAAGLCTMWDPLYYRAIAPRAWLYFAFHAFAIFAGTLVVAPVLLQITTSQTVLLASVSIAVLAVPSLLHTIDRRRVVPWALLVAGAAALGGLGWALKPWVPPATLWVHEAVITETVDEALRAPGVELRSVSIAHLHRQGLHAYTAIRAPRGLREHVHHRWLHEGREVDRIALTIVGGRAEGYRAWSFKRSFPSDPRGRWRVQVVTDGGQLIGELGFTVLGDPAADSAPRPADSASPAAPATPPASAPDRTPTPESPRAEPPPESPAAPEPTI